MISDERLFFAENGDVTHGLQCLDNDVLGSNISILKLKLGIGDIMQTTA